MKLTKTEKKILKEMQDSPYERKCITSYNGQGSSGGWVTGGNRERNAGLKLEKKGLIKRVNYYRTSIADSGYTVWVTDIDYILV